MHLSQKESGFTLETFQKSLYKQDQDMKNKDLKKAFFLFTMFIVIRHYYHSDVDIVFSGRMIIVTVTRSNLYYVET